MSKQKNEIPASFWISLVLGIAALLASPRFFDMIWGRHRETPVRQE
ncbi:MAG: hypothetical protein ACOX61_04240 [Brooklawnia sp.]